MTDKVTFACGLCEKTAQHLRNVRVRPDWKFAAAQVDHEFPCPAILWRTARKEYERRCRAVDRAKIFQNIAICNRCYRALDNEVGRGRVRTPKGLDTFELCETSRNGRPPLYAPAKAMNAPRKRRATKRRPAALAAPGTTPPIPCSACECESERVRSVMLRCNSDSERSLQQYMAADNRASAADADPQAQEQAIAACVAHAESAKYRRAFVCPACYEKLDSSFGVAAIQTPGGVKRFGIAMQSRGGKATEYDHPRWQRYQQQQAAKMGLDIST